MIKLEKTEVVGFEAAIRGMRNPMNSWDQSDSDFGEAMIPSRVLYEEGERIDYSYCVGHNDLKLMGKLCDAGTDHRKFMRMIVVYVDILAPLYWWKEFDTYKVGTVANSCSTMHKIHDKEFTVNDFSHENLLDCVLESQDGTDSWYLIALLDQIVECLNDARRAYIETKDKKYWRVMIELLPSSYNQKRTVMMNYEVLANIYKARKNHKLTEWHEFCNWINGLPYSHLITEGK